MSDFAQYLFMALGAGLIVVGILLLVFKPAAGENSLKLAGQEVHISAPGLLVIVLGCVMFAAPFLIPPRPGPAPTPEVKQDEPAPKTDQATAQPAETTPAPQPEPSSAPAATNAPPRCKSGYVWRIARPSDLVCVTPDSRTRTAQENALAASRVDPAGASGPSSCVSGHVWREAYPGDVVCVTPEIRATVQQENQAGPDHTEQ